MSTVTNTTIHCDPVPLQVDAGGVIRVGGTRIYLDLIVREYEKGTSPEVIAQEYDTLELPDVYAAIAYYLRHRDEVIAYLQRREQSAAERRRQIEAELPLPAGFKEKLLSRREQMRKEQDNAPPGQ
jgi:uncharacterized protein (DUF433 family)